MDAKESRAYSYPCGKCAACLITRRQEWTFRLLLELREYEYSYFITLTYDDSHLPEGGNLLKRDAQLFLKRLRKRVGKFRYFLCGEYGEKYGRAHYHAIIMSKEDFNLEFGTDKKGQIVIVNSAFHKAWSLDNRSIGIVDVAVIPGREDQRRIASYVAGYVLKKLGVEREDSLEKEFTLMSRKPGIGFKQLSGIVSAVERYSTKPIEAGGENESILYMVRFDGKKWPVSRTLRNEMIKQMGGDIRSDDEKRIYQNRKYFEDSVKMQDPEYKKQFEEHIECVNRKAEASLRKWQSAKRKNPSKYV